MKKILLTVLIIAAAIGYVAKGEFQDQASSEGEYKVADIRIGA
ncbi:hypothetical protein [Bacillus subtilis]